jgi:PEGA domain-containing protein
MEVRRQSITLKIVYVSLVLLGSVLFGYGLQAQTPSREAASQPPVAQQPQDATNASPQSAPAKPAPAQATTQNQTTSSRPADRDVDSVPSSRTRVHFSVAAGVGYSHFGHRSYWGGPFVGFGYYPYRYYSPFYDPFYGPYYWPYYRSFYGPAYPSAYYGPGYGRGEVKLSVDPKYAKVYVDGAFAGRAEDLKHIYLKPGTYTLSVQAQGHETYTEKIYVLSGKTLKIKTTLESENRPPSPEEKR